MFCALQDVILYNFFGSSPLKNWRVIYNFLLSENLCPSEVYSCPKFDLSKHYKLCSELKQLYVAITRARQRLWLCECTEASKPMFDLWKKKCVVEVRELTDSLIQAMQIVSTPEEWTARGIEVCCTVVHVLLLFFFAFYCSYLSILVSHHFNTQLYDELNYEMATLCFEKAGNEHWQKNSKAHGLKAAAERIQMSNPDKANSYLKEAAKLFEEIGKTKATGKQDILESYEPAATEVDQFYATEVVQFHRVPPTIDLISEKSVADQDCNSGNKHETTLPINLDNFRKTCDAINSLGDETGQVLMSNAQMIKVTFTQSLLILFLVL